jgi:hypothetical protein
MMYVNTRIILIDSLVLGETQREKEGATEKLEGEGGELDMG